jgi:hypothetical protein
MLDYPPVLTHPVLPRSYVTAYSRLGLVWVHCFSCKETKVAAAALAAIADRVGSAAAATSLLPQSPTLALARGPAFTLPPAAAAAGGAAAAEELKPKVYHVTCVVTLGCSWTRLSVANY